MKQIWISKAGPPEVLVLREGTEPPLHSGELKIKVEASGVNFADVLGRMGIYPDAPAIPYVPGYEVAGVVIEVGQGVTGFKEGDKVFALTRFNGYSEIVCVPHKLVFKRLEWMSVTDAAALPLNYLTAYQCLVVMGSLRPEDKLLIHNASGGVGLAALDIGKIIGAEMYGTASPGKHEFLRQRGLHHPIDYRHEDYERVIMEKTQGKGVHLILDPLGGAHGPKNYRLLMPTGRLVQFGASAAAPGKRRSWLTVLGWLGNIRFYSPFKLMNDNKGIIGVNIIHLLERAELLHPWMRQIVEWYDEALFRPHVDKTFTFAEAAAAHHFLQDRQNRGKLLLLP
jgi:NADPH:quinone reductase-like Zn-dependent oxidoreductase